MEIGCHLPTQGPVATREALTTFAREADGRGMASLWVSDHVIFPRTATGSYPGGRFPHPPDKAYLEPVVALAAAAVCTERARLGASMFILGHRHPVVMAKMLTSIDALSNGRLICGVGRGLVEGGARDPRRALPRPRPSGRRDPARVQGLVDGGQSVLQWRVLPFRQHRLRAQARAEAASADLGRRRQPRGVPPRGDTGRRLA